ncbi:hypothetical protein KC19_2G143300 [Ceratodon purpureus]|uniref:Uncharacterized protein n=1 Tax=Ceratodon purpureus TaxID=3225 RepID=A0A8T0IWR6_CERPU|nr:hypothetical protein KC19_2G143300 [Ceratodon purpureus]
MVFKIQRLKVVLTGLNKIHESIIKNIQHNYRKRIITKINYFLFFHQSI